MARLRVLGRHARKVEETNPKARIWSVERSSADRIQAFERRRALMEDRGPAAYIAELVGTFMLVLFIALIASVYARKGICTP
jgi:hypothetical protein